MNSLLNNKLALVTGGGSYMGCLICCALAKKGATVVVADSDCTSAEGTLNMLPGKSHISVVLDFTNNQTISSVLDKIQNTFKNPPSILVNCLAVVEYSVLQQIKIEHFQDLLRDNLVGMLAVIKTVSSFLMKENSPGSVINLCSATNRGYIGGHIFYTASNTAIEALTKCVAKDISKNNIRCNVVIPGVDMFNGHEGEHIVNINTTVSNEEAEKIGEIVAFLASDTSSCITGTVINIDGEIK